MDPKETPDWRTPSEADAYRSTSDLADTFAFLERLTEAAPRRLRIEEFGRSGEGRPLRVVIASGNGSFEPGKAHAAGRVVVLVQNCIHAGEPDGKDASLAMLRDIVRSPGLALLPAHVVLLVVPVYNVDGHERRSEHGRINQNGPSPAGWRANGTNLNLNRDYLKAEAPETRAFLRLLRRWRPDFFVDNHVTDGADFQYDVTFQVDVSPDVHPGTAAWLRATVIPTLVREVNDAGHLAFPYTIFLRDEDDPGKGLAFNENPPRFSTGRMILENRPGLLVEMHMLKDYRTRVRGNYELLRSLLGVVGRDADRLLAVNRAADEDAARLGEQLPAPREFPLVVSAGGDAPVVPFRGRAFTRFRSEISGAESVRYTAAPWETELPLDSTGRVEIVLHPPAAYLVPPAWTGVLEVLAAQGVELQRTTAEWAGSVESYLLTDMRWPSRPFEGRFPILRGGSVEHAFGRFGRCTPTVERRSYPSGTAVVPLDQRLSKVAVHWLEPEAPDSALRWGFFNPIFEQKESAERYVLEELAGRTLPADPALRSEFEARLAADPAWARSPRDRLEFFFDRSPWGRENRVGRYPVGRLSSLTGVPVDNRA